MRHNVTLLFDVEDLCWPGSDDIVLDLAAILTERGAPATFLVVGEKARLWVRRGRSDIIAALAPFDIGSHTNLHSIHPTASEYLAPCGWHDGVAEVLRFEAPGLASIQEVFGRPASSWGQAGGTWGPQIHAALAAAGVPCAIYPLTYTATSDVHWYAGALTFSGDELVFFDSGMLDATRFEACMTNLRTTLDRRIAAGQTWTGIFASHPTMLRATEFWDKLNFAAGRNTEPADYRMPELHPEASYRLALQNFATLVELLLADPGVNLTTIAALREVYRPPEQQVSPATLREAARMFEAEGGDLPTDNPHLSPAEASYLMALSLLHDGSPDLPRRSVGGPVVEPQNAAPGSLPWQELLQACRGLVDYVETNGHLPADVETAAGPAGIGAFARGCAAALLARDTGKAPAEVTLSAGRQTPAIAETIAEKVLGQFRGWPIHDPQLDPERLLLHTRLQCWTLRPAPPGQTPG